MHKHPHLFTFNPNFIIRLLHLNVNYNYFAIIFQRIKGTAMGAAFSPVIANIYMSTILNRFRNQPFTDQIRNYASFQICARMTKDAYMRHRHSPSLCGCRDRLEALAKRPKRSSGIALAAYIMTGSYVIVWGREPRDKTRMR